MRRLRCVAASLLLACSLAAIAVAQKASGEIHGTVFDPSHTVAPKAEVTVADTATNIAKIVLSVVGRSYLVPNLLDGTYTVSVSAAGFEKAEYAGVVVDTGRITDLPLTLKIGKVTETINVQAGATPLETTSDPTATTVRNEAVIDLPMAVRDTLTFASLSAGYTAGPSSTTGVFNALFEAALNISLDGVNIPLEKS